MASAPVAKPLASAPATASVAPPAAAPSDPTGPGPTAPAILTAFAAGRGSLLAPPNDPEPADLQRDSASPSPSPPQSRSASAPV